MHVEICKYKNVGRPLCKKIGVKVKWHDYMFREFKLMTLSGSYIVI
jgi:hypothetical protein